MAKQKYAQDELTGPAPSPPSLLKKAGNVALGGFSAAANLLDLPGSMLRDVATLHNPLDQLLTPFHGDNRTSGRDALRQYGLAGQEDTWGNFGAGLAVDIASDPMTYLTLGGSALGKAGRAAKAAGLMGDAPLAAAKKAGKAAGSIGKAEARVSSTLKDLVDHADDPLAAMEKLKTVKGFNPTDEIMNEPLGGVGRFWPTDTLLGTGATGQRVAKRMDDIGNALMQWEIPLPGRKATAATSAASNAVPPASATPNAPTAPTSPDGLIPAREPGFKPIAAAANLFNQSMRGATHAVNRALAGKADDAVEAGRAAGNNLVGRFVEGLKAQGLGEADGDAIRTAFEFPEAMAKMPEEFQRIAKPVQEMYRNAPGLAREAGYDLKELTNSISDYFHRSLTKGAKYTTGRGGKEFTTEQAANLERMEWSGGAKGGTATINKMSKDPISNELIDVKKASRKAIARHLKNTYKDVLPEKYLTREQHEKAVKSLVEMALNGEEPAFKTNNYVLEMAEEMFKAGDKKMKPRSTFVAAAETMASLPKVTREAGMFANHPAADLQNYTNLFAESVANGNHVLDVLSQPGMLHPASNAAKITDSMSVGELMIELKMSKDHGPAALAKRLGIDDPDKVADLWKQRVPKEVTQNLIKRREVVQMPEAVQMMTKWYDDITNVVKQVLVSTPKFQVRNGGSGGVNNALAGQFSGKSTKQMYDLLTGGVAEGASQIPAIQKMAAAEGIQNLDDKTASQLLGRLLFSHDATSSLEHATGDVIGKGVQGSKMSEIVGAIPGMEKFGWKKHVLNPLLGKDGYTWDLRKASWRGVNDASQSTYAPIGALNNVGHFVESMLRGAPMIALLEQGVDVAEAAKRVGEAQVKYGSRHYTPFEKEVMARLFPFMKYTKGMIPFTMRQLIEKPGGPLAQGLRTINRSKSEDELTPEYVQDSTAIPLGSLPDGSNRYLTGLGLSFEDPLSFMGGPQSAGLETLSRLNPMIKGPLEWVTGQSFFQKGPGGSGRSLEDLDPVIGRTLANVGNLTGLRESKNPVRYPGSSAIEHIASNSPLSPAFNIARTLTDPRKGVLAKATNTLTGLKVTDISPAAQDRLLRERVNQIEKELGAKSYTDTYLPKDRLEEMSDKERKDYEQLKALRNLLEARAKTRKKAG